MTVHLAKPEHEVAYQDLANLIRKHADRLTSLEMLAIGANMVGKLIALQDQRRVTRELAMKIVAANIEMGNRHLISDLATKSKGSS
jgi:hypothetical protein